MKNYNQVRKVLIHTLLLNILVAMAKIIYGTITSTASMIADGYHSFSDATSNIVGIVGVWISSKPADESHPYGHQKVETLSTIFISVLLFFVSYEIATGAYERFINPVIPQVDIGNFVVMIVTFLVNIFIVTYELKKGKELKSSFLISDAKHTQSDLYTSVSVIIGLVAIKLGYVVVDSVISVFIAILIAKAGVEILVEAINVLIDGKMIESDKICELVRNHSEVVYCHKIRTRGKENHIMVDLHLGVNSDYTIKQAHKISHEIESMLKEELEGVREVIVHVEPAKVEVE